MVCEKDFHFDRIPDELKTDIREMVAANEVRQLWLIHNKYNLSDYDYSCCNLDGMMDWFRYGVRKGLI